MLDRILVKLNHFFRGKADGTPGDTLPIEVLDPALADAPIVVTPRSTRNLIFRPGLGDPVAIASWPDIISNPVPAIDLVPAVDTEGVDRITILLAGGDAGPGRGGLRTDTIIVATLDTVTGHAALMSIPRNLVQVPLKPEYDLAFIDLEQQLTVWDERKTWTEDNGDGVPDQFTPCRCFPDQINAIYPFTRRWTETYPDEVDPGMAALRDTLDRLLRPRQYVGFRPPRRCARRCPCVRHKLGRNRSLASTRG